ncbi:MAG: hypothetical protein ABSB69_04595 [Solirubrobacteraceae bacterium]|jgi:hypothetical protein
MSTDAQATRRRTQPRKRSERDELKQRIVEIVTAEPGISDREIETRAGIDASKRRLAGRLIGELQHEGVLRYEAGWRPGGHVQETFSRVDRSLDPDAFAPVQHVAVLVDNVDIDMLKKPRRYEAQARELLEDVIAHWARDLGQPLALGPGHEYRDLLAEAARHVDMPQRDVEYWDELQHAEAVVEEAHEREALECAAIEEGVIYPAYFAELVQHHEGRTSRLCDGKIVHETVALRALPDHLVWVLGDEVESVLHRSPAWGPDSYSSGAYTLFGTPFEQRVAAEVTEDVGTDSAVVYPFDVTITWS